MIVQMMMMASAVLSRLALMIALGNFGVVSILQYDNYGNFEDKESRRILSASYLVVFVVVGRLSNGAEVL